MGRAQNKIITILKGKTPIARKRIRLVHLRKSGRKLDDPAGYMSFCLLSNLAKLIVNIVMARLVEEVEHGEI